MGRKYEARELSAGAFIFSETCTEITWTLVIVFFKPLTNFQTHINDARWSPARCKVGCWAANREGKLFLPWFLFDWQNNQTIRGSVACEYSHAEVCNLSDGGTKVDR